MIYKTWHERERSQWHSRMATRRGDRESEREAKGDRDTPHTCARGLNEWRREREEERECERNKGGKGVVAWRFHYGDVSLRQTYAPLTSCPLAVYISRYFIFICPRNS